MMRCLQSQSRLRLLKRTGLLAFLLPDAVQADAVRLLPRMASAEQGTAVVQTESVEMALRVAAVTASVVLEPAQQMVAARRAATEPAAALAAKARPA
jgi:hypothetical protein